MPMMRLGDIAPPTPFHSFVCSGCGKLLAKHYVYRPGKFADVRPGDKTGRQYDGKLRCHQDGLGYAGSYHQRQLRRTMAAGYENTLSPNRAGIQ